MMDIQGEVKQLVEEIKRLGDVGPDGKVSVKFVKLIDDERCGNIFEAIIGTLKAARKNKVIDFEGEFLLKGVHDDVEIKVL
ncbi:Costars family protein ABRACL [Gracilariopsis chorda]|uniref:Costars family protein ABRACL n=1 Tax=Gracilariopsis chorda TaxID=448386 RepID=A0A2V3IUR9_9FLOR|nr:Costars family protein ABRACL [Gracilariopsis chorda]|eukprot:PXF45864.1 Costars family protein ABRACL [Gracilariopsis chorda]